MIYAFGTWVEIISGIQTEYGVNPFIFIGIYILTTPLFGVSVYYFVRSYRLRKPLLLPSICLFISYSACYVYLFLAGQNLPVWIYIAISIPIVFGVYRTKNTIQRKAKIAEEKAILDKLND